MLNVFKTIQLYSNNNKWKHIKRNQIFFELFFPSSFLWQIFKLPTWWHLLGTALIQSNLGDNVSHKSYFSKTSSLSNPLRVIFSNYFNFFSVKIFAFILNRKPLRTKRQMVLQAAVPRIQNSSDPSINCQATFEIVSLCHQQLGKHKVPPQDPPISQLHPTDPGKMLSSDSVLM